MGDEGGVGGGGGGPGRQRQRTVDEHSVAAAWLPYGLNLRDVAPTPLPEKPPNVGAPPKGRSAAPKPLPPPVDEGGAALEPDVDYAAAEDLGGDKPVASVECWGRELMARDSYGRWCQRGPRDQRGRDGACSSDLGLSTMCDAAMRGTRRCKAGRTFISRPWTRARRA